MTYNVQHLDPDHDLYDWAAFELVQLRRVHGVSHREVAEILGKHRSLISKIEAGESNLQVGDAEVLDRTWDTGGRLARIIRLAKSRHSSEWRDERAKAESQASAVRIWALGWVPVLAQTIDYARAVFVDCGRRDVDAAVEIVKERQAVLSRAPSPLVWLLIDQDALEHQVGDKATHLAQLLHLEELAQSPTWTIRVVSRTAGGHVGRDGAFEMYRVDAHDIPYTETLGPGRLITDASEMAQYEVWFRRIGDVAESKAVSLRMIREIMEEFR